MSLTGHKTRSVFERYNVSTSTDREQAVAKLAGHLGQGSNRGASPQISSQKPNQQETA